jgi:hypothetical protein
VSLGAQVPDPAVCPFLRSADDDGVLGLPFDRADERNRCAALADAMPLPARQQRLVCLGVAHADCPRYLRGSGIVREPGPARGLTRSTAAAALILVASALLSVSVVLARGGLQLPEGPPPAPTDVVVTSPVPPASPPIIIGPTPDPSSDPVPTADPTAEPTPAAPSPTAEPTTEPSPTPAASVDQYAYLEPCPDRPDCWIYVARRGNSLSSISTFFNVPFDRVVQMNPQLGNPPRLRVGDKVFIPTPRL